MKYWNNEKTTKNDRNMENENEKTTVIGYKGFDKDWKCRGFQYEVGKEYETDEAKLCKKGFHFCENPHDVFNYYAPGESRFAVVETQDVTDEKEEDSKRVCKKIRIKAEISVSQLCKMAVSVFFERFGFKKKIESADTNNAGDYGAANAGYKGAANAGNKGAANAGDIKWNDNNNRYEVTDWACGIVDGVNIKEDTWYRLENGKLVETEVL